MTDSKRRIRCAIYTRKSSEEGLDQDFNSLDAQFEAAAAYIASQKHEGWKQASQRYDDGGISGGTLERPGLQKLLDDIKAGLIDMVVVYKIDRLTRSLADFAKLVERFEAQNCSFVSVTQAFNTSSSMGRLTLNVLLSFAQFEREVTAERIRDKIAASKMKGLWMGGMVPIGYDKPSDPNARQLVLNEHEAITVRRLFDLYDQLGCVNAVAQQASSERLRSKSHTFASGRTMGNKPFSRGQIYYLLRNPIYRGLIRHKMQTFEGQHPAIINQDQWDRVQQKLQDNKARPRRSHHDQPKSRTQSSPLAGKLFDETGDRLTPSHTSKNGKRHRYYVSRRLIKGTRSDSPTSGWRLPARQIEQQIIGLMVGHFDKTISEHRLTLQPDAGTAPNLNKRLAAIDQGLDSLAQLISRCTIAPGQLRIELDQQQLAHCFGMASSALCDEILTITAPFQLRRRGVEAKIISGTKTNTPDAKLIDVLGKAHNWLHRLKSGEPVKQIATAEGHAEYYISTRVRLALLSPKIQEAILAGNQPADLSLETLVKRKIPISWDDQERRFGFEE